MYRNGQVIGASYSNENNNTYVSKAFNTMHSILALHAGDKTWMQVDTPTQGVIFDDQEH